ncbi:MAG: hypothetical protein ACD_72C00098G0006 [uncultured bacterium]|nr:MAG: hypothetical protein ACD_72C00098G0006 [uncultured bacterium]
MNQAILEQAILKTLAYFDLNNYPLTSEEIGQFLFQYKSDDFKALLSALDEMKIQNKIQEKFGYFYLVGKEEIVENRRVQLVISELKLRKARKAAKFIRYVPFLRAIFVCNTVSAGTATASSDIDFFIITAMGRIWIVRFFTNLILRLFGLRTYGDKISDKICLSFFVDDNNLNLEKLKAVDLDIHFVYWTTQMIPIYDPQNYWKKFLTANYWIKNYLPNFSNNSSYLNLVNDGKVGKVWKKAWEIMWQTAYGDLIEKQMHDWQLMKLRLSIKEKAEAANKNVVISDGVIKLHEHDTRGEIFERWQKKVSELCL